MIAEKNDILLFEDKERDAASIREMVITEDAGCHFNICNTANFIEGLSMLSHIHFDAVLLDLSLSDMNGLDALKMVHNTAPNIPIIVLTNSQEEFLGALAMGDGAQDYLVKGKINGTTLIHAISHAIKHKIFEESLVLRDRAIECSIECIAFADMNGNIVYANSSMLQNLRYASLSDISGINLWDIVTNSDSSAFTLKSLMDIGSWSGEERVTRTDGSLLDVLISASVVRNHGSESICIMISWVDISHQKAAEKALRMMSTAFCSSLTGIATMDINGNLISLNEAFLSLIGKRDVGEIIGKPIDKLFTNAERFRECLHTIRTNKNWSGEISSSDSESGLTKWIKGTVNLVNDVDLNPMYLFGTFMEISNQKDAGVQLFAGENKFRQLFELANEGILMTDKDDILVMANPRLSELLNCGSEEIIGKSVHSIMGETDPTNNEEDANRRKNQGANLSKELPLRRIDGTTTWVNITSTQITDSDGKYCGTLSFITDITERKQIEIQLRSSKHDSEKKERRAQKYFDILVNDIANIISPVLVYSQMISTDKSTPPKISKLCIEIEDQSRRASSLISNLRRLDEIERIPLCEIENVDLIPVLKSVESSICEQYKKRAFKISHSFPNDEEIIVKGFSIINDIIRKILDNAARYSDKDTVSIDIKASKCKDSFNHEYWQVDINDNGPGIPPEYKQSVIIHSESANYLVRNIFSSLQFCAQLMWYIGGDIKVYDREPGDMTKGTKVTIKIPVGD